MRHLPDKRELSNLCNWVISRMHGWTFWKVFEGTGMPERLPDLGLGIKGVKLQPGKEKNIGDRRGIVREHRRTREKRRERCLRACVVNCDWAVPILRSAVCSSKSTVRLCEHPKALSLLSTRATALLWAIQESSDYWTPPASEATNKKYIIDIGTLLCITIRL